MYANSRPTRCVFKFKRTFLVMAHAVVQHVHLVRVGAQHADDVARFDSKRVPHEGGDFCCAIE